MNRKIPKVASASLVLGAMGCGGSSSATPTDVARLYCNLYNECDPYDFKLTYSSISECTSYAGADLANQIKSYSSSCRSAILNFYNCYYGKLQAATNSCSMAAQSNAAAACQGFYNTITKQCPPKP